MNFVNQSIETEAIPRPGIPSLEETDASKDPHISASLPLISINHLPARAALPHRSHVYKSAPTESVVLKTTSEFLNASMRPINAASAVTRS